MLSTDRQTVRRLGFQVGSSDLKFAAVVAEFGMILRDSEFKREQSLGEVIVRAQQGRGADANGYGTGFIQLVRKAEQLKARM
jgi:Ca-activated chloride channel family protein